MIARICRARYWCGFTLIELLMALAVLTVLLAVLLPQIGRTTCGSRQLKCATQVRGILQGFEIWAQSNNGFYPMPSIIDGSNDTIATGKDSPPEAKDISANIMSILLYNGYVPTEMLVTPAEVNSHIKPFEGYSFSNPAAAANPSKALWDPAFGANFIGSKPGGLSYAHAFPIVPLEVNHNSSPRWGNASRADQVVIGNRGPEIRSVNGSDPVPAQVNSNTFLIHGSRRSWEGNVGFNDNHVDFVSDMFGPYTYTDTKGARKPDCMFFDETNSLKSENNYLGIFVKAGRQRTDFAAIWD